MRISQSQSDNLISRYKKPTPILPELQKYLTENSTFESSFKTKTSNYDMSFMIPKKILDKSEKEFQPFYHERDRLGRLLSKSKNSNLNTVTYPNEQDTISDVYKQMRTNYLDTSFIKTQKSNDDSTLQKKGSLKLNSVVMMHLSEFYQQTQDKKRKSREFQNYQQDQLVEDQETDNILKIQNNDFINISQIIPKEITQTKLSIEGDITNQNSTTIKQQQQPSFKQMKSKFQQLKEFSILYCNQDNLTQDDNNFMQEIAKMYTEPKRKIQLYRKKDALPCIGQYDIAKCDSIRFKKSPVPFISRDEQQFQKKEIKDSLEQYMQQIRNKKSKYSQSLKNITKTEIAKSNKDEYDETSLPPLKIRNVKVVYDNKYVDEGSLFDQMNSEFYKYPQEFSEKLKWAQKKVQKIQNDLRTWDERCKLNFKEKKKDPLNC